MIETKQYFNTRDKTSWGEGAWQTEPDKKQWQDEATGLPCLIVRNHMGALCGYAGVPAGHPAYGRQYDALEDIDAHGGLTFADRCQKNEDPAYGICHIAPAGEDDIWWFGFDCAHFMDHVPGMKSYGITVSSDNVYRDFAYVTAEVAALAKQLKAITQPIPNSPQLVVDNE